jgi:hypothetical protein
LLSAGANLPACLMAAWLSPFDFQLTIERATRLTFSHSNRPAITNGEGRSSP